ncbi:unnamed protein product, partial [Staurois parvus]
MSCQSAPVIQCLYSTKGYAQRCTVARGTEQYTRGSRA